MAIKQDEIIVRIDDAITHYNNKRKKGTDPMTRGTLATKLFSRSMIEKKRSDGYFTKWNNGKDTGGCKPKYLLAICKATGVDMNYLLNVKPMKK